MKKLLLLVILLASVGALKAQDVVVSEYYNISGVPQGEWTELLVIKDNMDLTGYVIRDNSDGNGWQGGAKFRDNPLWKNLRSGAIIVINHRNYQWNEDDFNKADGHIAVSAENATYFDKVLFNATDWAASALSMNQTNDMLQIIDASGRHVHLLGHMAVAQPDYTAITGPKIAYQGDVNNGATVRVVPGTSLTAYSAGLGIVEATTGNITPADARGLPNQPFNNPPNLDKNQLFWRKLRQPSWTSNTVNAGFVSGKIKLEWTSASASDTDPAQGYIILRIKANEINSAPAPTDGSRYAVGDKIGSATVAALISSISTSEWTDDSKLECGTDYIYRVYAYRFDADDLGKDIIRPENARGRQFNETEFGQSQLVSLPVLDKPTLTTREGKTNYCVGETAQIKADYSEPSGKFTFKWLKDEQPVSGGAEHDITVTESGTYKLQIETQESCVIVSDPIEIKFAPYPVAYLSLRKPNGSIVGIYGDTAIFICDNENNSLIMSAGDTRQWTIDGIPLNTLASEINIDKEGVFQGIAINNGDCADSSVKVSVKYKQVSFSVSPSPLVFDFDTKPQSTLTIKNNGDEPIVFLTSDFKISTNFEIVAPAPPFVVSAKGTLDVTIRYKRSEFGDFTDNFSLVGECGKSRTLVFKSGRKKPAETILIASPESIDFGRRSDCNKLDTTVTVFAYGLNTVYSTDISFTESGFSVQGASGIFQLDSMQKVALEIKYFGGVEGVHTCELIIPYNDSLGVGYDDTLRILIRIEYYTAKLSISATTLNFPEIGDCEEYSSLNVTLTNPGNEPIVIKEQPADERLGFATPLPIVIQPGEAKEVELRFYYKYDPVPFNTDILFEPCAKKLPVTVNGSKQGLSVTFNSDSIFVGAVANCSGLTSVSSTLDITAFGGEISISGVTISPGFTTDLIPGAAIDGKLTYRLTYIPAADGLNSGEIRIKFQPCDREKVIKLAGFRGDATFAATPSEIDFGKLAPGSALPQFFAFRNTSGFPLRIESLSGVAAPFAVIPIGATLPTLLLPDSTLNFQVSYNQTEVSKTDFANMIIIIDSPCNLSQSISLKGATSNPFAKVIAKLKTADRYTVGIGESIKIPFEITSVNGEKFADANIDTVELFMSYNWKVIDLKWFTGFDGSSIKSFVEPNRDKLTLAPRNSLNLQDGVWGSLEVRGLLAQEFSTTIVIDSVRLVSDIPVEFDTLSSPIVEVIGDCGDGGRAALSLGSLKLSIEKASSDGDINIKFNVLEDGVASLKIYDSRGALALVAYEGSAKKGERIVPLPEGKLSRGVYFVTYSHLGVFKTVGFVVD